MKVATYRLRADGADLTVDCWTAGERNHARLLIDGDERAADQADAIGSVDLCPDDGPHVRVVWWWKGRVARVALVESGGRRARLTPFRPPAGTRAARLYGFEQRHPGLYAARHVAVNVGGTILALFGVGALLRALLPKLDLDVGIDLPQVTAPDWLRYLDPGRYLGPVVEWIAGWLPDLPDLSAAGPWVKYVIGLAVACAIAVEEYQRRKRRASEQPSDGDDHGADGRP